MRKRLAARGRGLGLLKEAHGHALLDGAAKAKGRGHTKNRCVGWFGPGRQDIQQHVPMVNEGWGGCTSTLWGRTGAGTVPYLSRDEQAA
jgi:hypothetical protein